MQTCVIRQDQPEAINNQPYEFNEAQCAHMTDIIHTQDLGKKYNLTFQEFNVKNITRININHSLEIKITYLPKEHRNKHHTKH